MGERLMALFVDEFLFVSANSYPTLLPLLVNGAAMILTSSMSASADGEIKRMLDAKLPDGRAIMLRLDWIRACHTCTAQGQAAKCTHIMQRPQHFQSEVDRARVQALMKPFGEEAFARELLNITGRALTEPAFRREWIEPLRDRATDWRALEGAAHAHFFVALDPAGEGFSQNVLVSAYVDTQSRPNGAPYTVVVLAAESCAVEDAEQLGQCVVRHIQAVRRQVPGMRDATAVVVLESNLPLVAPTVARRLEESSVPRVCIMREDRKRARDGSVLVRAGTRTSRENKPEMVAALQEVLMMHALRFHATMAVPQPPPAPAPGETAPHPGAPLVAQLLAFKREIKMPRPGSLAPPAIHYTGKPGLDDMVMALAFILLNYEVFMVSPAYRGYR